MDIVERLRGDYGLPIAFETIPICHEAADEIERLREQVDFERASLQAAFGELRKLDGDIERLHQQNAELVKTLRKYADEEYNGYNANGGHARAAIAKATGGE